MKKSLFLTSALVAASVLALGATDTLAATKAKKVKLEIGGSYKAVVGYARQSTKFETRAAGTASPSYANRDIKTDSEVHFKGSTKTSNGLDLGVHIELETDQTNATDIDGSFITIGSSFGTVAVGSAAAASAVMYKGAPSVGAIGVGGGDSSEWIIKPAANKVAATAGNNIGGGDHMKLRWVSKPFSGFQLGGSWVPSTTNSGGMAIDGGNSAGNTTAEGAAGTDNSEASQIDVALNYTGKMGANAVAASVTLYSVSSGTQSTDNITVSGNTTIGAFTLGAGYKETRAVGSTKMGLSMATSGADLSPEAKMYNYGISWKQGNIQLSGNYFKFEMPLSTTVNGDDTLTKYTLGATYAMSPGVDLLGSIQNVQWKDELITAGNSNSGVAVVGGIKVSF